MKLLTLKIQSATCHALIQILLCTGTAYAQQASSSPPRISVGLSLGGAAVSSRIPVEGRKHLHCGLNVLLPVSTSIGVLGELSYGSWNRLEVADRPSQWSEPPIPHFLTNLRGRYLEWHIGPILRLGGIHRLHLFTGAAVGIRYFRERWEYLFSCSAFPCGPTEIHGTVQARLRLAGDADAFGAALEACYIWSNRIQGNADSIAYSRPDGLRLLLKIPLYPLAYGIERTTYQPPRKPTTVYMRGVSGTLMGLAAGICAIDGSLILLGEVSNSTSHYTIYSIASVAGGVIGSALGISRAREDLRLTSVGARLAGGAVAAVTETLIFSKLFDFNLPNPGLMLAVPLGSMLGERLLIRH